MPGSLDSVKLFVSSTFEDMHAERDHLNGFVFPELRKRCHDLGVDFVAVDLRWGVTRAEAEQQGTTALCMREVDRCRPFFIALVGDRYGWIPAPEWVPLPTFRAAREVLGEDVAQAYALDETTGEPVMRLMPNAVSDDEQRLRVVRSWAAAGLPGAGKSLTELEIDRALQAPGTQALFYLREPPVHVHPEFPDALLPTFASADANQRRKLAELKARLVSHQGTRPYAPRFAGMRVSSTYLPNGLSARERGVLEDGVVRSDELATLTKRLQRVVERHGRVALDGLDEWGEQVVDDLWARIQSATAGAPARADGQLGRERARLFVGREDLIERARAFAAADDGDGLLVFTGPSGSGKSALMAECATACRREEPAPVVLAHFVGAAPGTTDLSVTLRLLCERLREACDLRDEVPAAPMELEFALAGFLERAAAERRVVVLLDALDQLDPAGGSHELRWLPTRLPPNVRVIVSTLPGAPLDRLRERVPDQRVIEVGPLPAADREELIRRALSDRGKRLTPAQTERLLDARRRPDAVRPLYLLVAVEELSLFGDFAGLDRRLDRLPAQLWELFDQVLARLELDHGRAITESALRLLAAARSGLLESEVKELLAAFTPLAWSRLRLALDFYLRPAGERDEGVTGFYHDGLRAAVERRYGDAQAAHRRLAGYFLGRARLDDGWNAAATRALGELAFHHVRGGLATDLARLLEDPAFLEARLRAVQGPSLLADFDLLLRESGSEIDAAGLGLIRDALRLAAHLLRADPTQVGSQLWARLAPHASPAVDGLRAALRDQGGRPWLRPYRSMLTVAGSPLRMTLSGMGCINGVVVSPDDSLALTHDDANTLCIWDLRSGLLRRTIRTTRRKWLCRSVRHPTLPIAVAGFDKGGLLVVDMDAGEVVARLPSHDGLTDIAVSLDGREVWTAHEGGRVQIRPLESEGRARTVDVGQEDVTAIVAAGGDRAFIGVGHSIQEWDLGRREIVRTVAEAEGPPRSLALAPGARRLAAGWDDGRIALWDLVDGDRTDLSAHRDRAFRNDVDCLAFTPDGERLVSASWDETVRVWSLSGAPQAVLRGHSMAIYALAVFDGGRRAVSGSKDGTLRVWDLRAPAPEPEFMHDGAVDALAARGRIVVSGGRDRRLAVWELETGRAIHHWPAHAGSELHEGWITTVALDADGERVHSAAKDGTLKTWTADGTLLDSVEGDWGDGGKTALARDVPLLVADNDAYVDAHVSFWRVGRTRRSGRVKVEGTRTAIGVAPDGRVAVATDFDGGAVVADPNERRVLWNKEGREGRRDYPESVAVSPDGRWAIVGLSNGRVELWDLQRRRRRRTFRLHADHLEAVAISPDGALGCSASWDRVLRVWKLETGEVIASYSSDDGWSACIFGTDARRVLAADERGGLHFLALENYSAERAASPRGH